MLHRFHSLLMSMLLWILTGTAMASQFDHAHPVWDKLLHEHVIMIDQGRASQVDYQAFLQDRNTLQHYLKQLSEVSAIIFSGWNKQEQLAFLINAYNASVLDLILSRYPKLDSVEDMNSLLNNPWKREFIVLLGKKRSLDEIKHKMILNPGDYNEPRIHFAINCASIGCPALRNEAYAGKKLEQQLETVTKAFLEDRGRNRFNATDGNLEISRIFDWYIEDFERGWGGWHSLNHFLVDYADSLTDTAQDKRSVATGNFKVQYLDFNWNLNDKK